MIRNISGYNMSEDYVLLFELAKKHSVVCEIPYRDSECRDIGHTLFTDSTFEVSARGIGYIYAESMAEFIEECKKLKLKFVFPCFWPGRYCQADR